MSGWLIRDEYYHCTFYYFNDLIMCPSVFKNYGFYKQSLCMLSCCTIFTINFLPNYILQALKLLKTTKPLNLLLVTLYI